MTRLTRALALSLSALLLALVVSVGAPAASAQAAMKYPDGFSPKAWIINVVSSVLAAAGDTDLQRALMANSTTYDHSFEGLEQQFKATAPGGLPSTPGEYQIVADKYFLENNLTSTPGDVAHPNNVSAPKFVAGAKIPATKAKKFTKALGGIVDVSSVIGSAFTGFQVGKLGAEAFGMDVSGLCSPTFADAGLVALVTGTDCDAFYNLPGSFLINQDAAGGVSAYVCHTSGTPCMSYVGFNVDATWGPVACFEWAETPIIANMHLQDGYRVVNGGPPTPVTGSTNPLKVYCAGLGGKGYYRPDASVLDAHGAISGWSHGSQTVPTPVVIETADPDRSLVCDTLGTDGVTYTETSALFKESAGKLPDVECAALPPGVGVDAVKVDETGGDAGPVTLLDEQTTPEYKSWRTAYPECVQGACSLQLIDKRGAVPVSCFDSAASAEACNGWMLDPDKGLNYQCTYGSHDVDIDECYAYANVFSPEKIAAGAAYADPATGQSVMGQSSPSAGREAMSGAIQDPADMPGCLSNGWAAANPIEWVLVPVVCALQSQFVPSPEAVIVSAGTVSSAWDETMPGQLATVAADFDLNPVVSGCKKTVTLFDTTFEVLDACPGSALESTAALSRLLLNVSVTVGLVFALTRYIGGTVEYGGL